MLEDDRKFGQNLAGLVRTAECHAVMETLYVGQRVQIAMHSELGLCEVVKKNDTRVKVRVVDCPENDPGKIGREYMVRARSCRPVNVDEAAAASKAAAAGFDRGTSEAFADLGLVRTPIVREEEEG